MFLAYKYINYINQFFKNITCICDYLIVSKNKVVWKNK